MGKVPDKGDVGKEEFISVHGLRVESITTGGVAVRAALAGT